MATTADFKNGMCIEYNNDIYTIVSFQHVKPGKGGAFVRTKLKSLSSGKVIENTFNSGVKINPVRVERRPFQFLYKDADSYYFMDGTTYDQVAVEEKVINAPSLLKDGQDVEVMFHAETSEILSCELPPFVELVVTYTEPGLKGDTATKTFKPATLETGASIQVPLFIDVDEKIKVDTRTMQYVERVK